MSTRLHDALDDLVVDRAPAVHRDAAAAWAEGARRRRTRRRQAVAGAVAVLVVALLGWQVAAPAGLRLQPAGTGAAAQSHPQRLEHLWWDRELPDAPGPLAGLVERSGEDLSGWWGVSPEGRMWRLRGLAAADYVPALSPDGSHLGLMAGSMEEASYEIRDLADGSVVEFSSIHTGLEVPTGDDERFYHSSQAPSWWSPDSSRVLVNVEAWADDATPQERRTSALALGTDGSVAPVLTPPETRSSTMPLGWVDDDSVALVDLSRGPDVQVLVVGVDTGRLERTVVLRDVRGSASRSQWFGSTSPDGTLLATGVPSSAGDLPVRLWALTGPDAGRRTAPLQPLVDPTSVCPPSWSSDALHIASAASPWTWSVALARPDGAVDVVADPRLEVSCSTWARSALDGGAHRGLGGLLLGTADGWLAWHWREVALGVGAAAGWLVTLLLVVRRRRREAG